MAPTRSGGTGKRGGPKKAVDQPVARKINKEPKQADVNEKKGRARSSKTQNEAVEQSAVSSGSGPGRGRKRKTQDAEIEDADEIASAPAATAPKYVHLAPKTRRIPEDVIEKWPVISPPVLEQISAVLRRAKDDIALSRRDAHRQEEADEVLNTVIRQLENHFKATKVPPQAKALNFDLDQLTAHNERVHRDLTTSRHRKQLLEEQIDNAAAKLKAEEKFLKDLKENAQQWRRQWKSEEKKQLHPLLQQSENDSMINDKPDDIGLRKRTPVDTSMLDTPDSELAPLLASLRRNLETMQGNYAQVDGIEEAVRYAQVALDDVLFKHASALQYDGL